MKEFKALAQELIDAKQPGRYNQAIMEFGARYCVPQNPDCENCIFNDRCEAYRLKKVNELPVKSKKLKIKKRYFNYMVAVSADNKTVLQQRKGKGIWQQLYEFPLIEQPSEVDIEQLKQSREFQSFSANYCAEDVSLYNETPIVHKLSHQHLHTRFWIVEVSDLQEKGIPVSEVSEFAVPVLIQNFISDFSQWNH
jgi:A/G-specific adenine glycosylase